MKLTRRLQDLIILGVKHTGSYKPGSVLAYIGESLYMREIAPVEQFLNYVCDNSLHFGTGNIKQLWKEANQ